jgi:short-subunit dehydrogenase
MQVNFFGVIRLTNLVLSYMLKDNAKNVAQKIRRRNYSIVNVGSVQSYLAIPYRGPCKKMFKHNF